MIFKYDENNNVVAVDEKTGEIIGRVGQHGDETCRNGNRKEANDGNQT